MVKLLINGRFLTRPVRGVDRSALELLRAVAQASRETTDRGRVELAVAVPHQAPPNDEIRATLALPRGTPIYRSRLGGYLWEQLTLARLEPDSILLSLCNMGPVLRRRQLVLIHDTQVRDAPYSYSLPFRLSYRLLQPVLAKRAELVATVSEFSRQRVHAHGLARGRAVHVLANGADHIGRVVADRSVLDRIGVAPGGYLLALAHSAPHKNIARLIRACELRADRGLPLVLVGGGTLAQGSGLPLSDAVVATGPIHDGELRALYENARLFLIPSLTEGFGLPAVEAMACGCPVIASTGGALPEVCGDAAVLCDPCDVEAWTTEIETLQHDQHRLHIMSARGKIQAAKFTWRNSAGKIVSALSQVSPSQLGRESLAEKIVLPSRNIAG